jgi:hypothetical protein
MKNLESIDKKSLQSIINILKENKFGIPDFQRDFEWGPWDVTELIKSIFEDYYIGTLLLWRSSKENTDYLSCEPIYGAPNKKDFDHIVLDGQQRLSALYYAFFAPDKNFPRRKSKFYYYVKIDKLLSENYDEAFYYDISSKNADEIFSTKEKQFELKIFPLKLFSSSGFGIPKWIEEYKQYWDKKESNTAEAEKEKLMDIMGALLTEYEISYIELDKQISVEKVCDIFQKINSTGLDLNIFDLMNALLRPKDIFLRKSWDEVANGFDGKIPSSDKVKIYVLQVISILEQNYCAPKFLYYLIPGAIKQEKNQAGKIEKKVLIESKQEFCDHWNNSIKAMDESLKILNNHSDLGAINPNFFPYPTMLPIFTALNIEINNGGYEDRNGVQKKIRQWYWSSIFTKNYSSSVESQMAKDYIAMKNWFKHDENIPEVVLEARKTYKSLELEKENSSNSAIYKGIFCILVRNGAQDFTTFQDPIYTSLEDHHIVPKSWGIKNGVYEINSILNRTPISDNTNKKVILDKLPNKYLNLVFEKNKDEGSVNKMLKSHFINKDILQILMRKDFCPDDFREYILLRKKLIIDKIGELIGA